MPAGSPTSTRQDAVITAIAHPENSTRVAGARVGLAARGVAGRYVDVIAHVPRCGAHYAVKGWERAELALPARCRAIAFACARRGKVLLNDREFGAT